MCLAADRASDAALLRTAGDSSGASDSGGGCWNNLSAYNYTHSHTFIKRPPLGYTKGGLLIQVGI